MLQSNTTPNNTPSFLTFIAVSTTPYLQYKISILSNSSAKSKEVIKLSPHKSEDLLINAVKKLALTTPKCLLQH
jgi:hypothetical protein